MLKIPTIFERDFKTNLVYDKNVEGLDWFWQGEGWATRKWDGTPVLVKEGKLYKRYINNVRKANQPSGFIALYPVNEETGQQLGWIPVSDDSCNMFYFSAKCPTVDGTYELCGPGIANNKEMFAKACFIQHGVDVVDDVPRTFLDLIGYMRMCPYEGIVWYRGNGVDYCKLKKKDFGFERV